jgi:putative ABC transport system permease protein
MIGEFRRDLLFSARSLSRRPGFTLVAVLTLALGIGSNVAIFSAIYGVLLRPLPYPQPDRLTVLWAQWPKLEIPRVSHTGGDFRTYQRLAKSFEGIAAVGSLRQNLTGSDEPAQVQVGWVSRNFFSVLATKPALGRSFAPDEPSNSLILSDGFWHGQLGADPGVIGRTVQLDGQPFTVIGVLPRGFKLHMSADVGISTNIDAWKPPDEVKAPDRWVVSELKLSTLRVIGRLRPGVTVAQAQAEMDRISEQLQAQFPDHAEAGFRVDVQPLHREVVGHVEPALRAVQAAVGLVLLIACLNVANLLLARAQGRQREIAVRLSLGSGIGGVARQMLIEALVLAIAGTALGLLLASWGIHLLMTLKPANFPRLESISLDPPVLVFAVGLMLASTLVSGLVPALRIRSWNLNGVLKENSLQSRGGDSRLSKMLIIFEVAMSLVLLLGTGLLVRSFARLQDVRPGFDTQNLLTFSISLPGARYEAPLDSAAFIARLENSIESLPGVTSAAMVWPLPLEGQIWYGPYVSPERAAQDVQLLADYRIISPSYPEAIGARLIEGRHLRDTDTHAILIDQRFAEQNWPGRSALGRTIQANPVSEQETFQVVGVIENIRHKDLRSDGRETFYLPAKGWSWTDWEICFVVRTADDPQALIGPIREKLRLIDPQIPMAKVRPMESYVSDALGANRFALALMLVFSVTSLILAAVGLYGVVAYALGRRTREIGIRMALGASRWQIFARSIREGMIPVLLGIGLGLLGSFTLAKVISGLLFGVGMGDPLTYVAMAALLVLIALLACFVPARRAVYLNPMNAIYQD